MDLSILRTTRSAILTVATLIGVGLFSGTVAAGAETDLEAHNTQRVTDAFDRWAAGGTEFFSDMLTSDITWTIKGSGPSAGVYRGMDPFIERAIKPFVSRLSSPVRPLSKHVWADGDHVIVQWEGAGVARDGRAYNNSYVWIFHMRDGKAFEVTAYLDLVPYDDVLRRIPAPSAE
ncbi:nuclear transport factor 2 family protein [Pseudomonas sp. CDFA 602]|uniref:nuclear transport factor 2 family protein n=1 Tax=Pseudomonas californiensis TaxID=2829823 RepID=UPI001E52407E|nr:nuclear transport factor 2 family protein [Pseudomonas californiensis]MCD5996157.1 nuclear transport factor 2 family protein [Pseudomonas californiensis]MCD6001795.1 nuclear transport factor 2 family protein [Pseudomonas californiensis]